MRILVISDIHANYNALEAVLADAGEVDETWCLGDVIGYGPDPNVCIELLRERPRLTCLMGNHDAAVTGRMLLESFNGEARRSLEWQERVLMSDNMNFLRTLPSTLQVRSHVSLVHGSPRDPVWEYVLNTLTARLNFEAFDTDLCFVGHSHIQCFFHLDENKNRINLDVARPEERIELKPRMILNPGSVGQPRDRDPRAAYAIYDDEKCTWEAHRAVYDWIPVQQRILEAGLPPKHAARLAEGW